MAGGEKKLTSSSIVLKSEVPSVHIDSAREEPGVESHPSDRIRPAAILKYRG